jgi:hypothetical protein
MHSSNDVLSLRRLAALPRCATTAHPVILAYGVSESDERAMVSRASRAIPWSPSLSVAVSCCAALDVRSLGPPRTVYEPELVILEGELLKVRATVE